MLRRLLCTLLFIAGGPRSNGNPDAADPYDLNQETISEKVVWKSPMWMGKSVNLSSWNYNTMITSFRDHTYIVYVDENRRPRLVKLDHENRVVDFQFLDHDEKAIYRSRDDGHHTFSIGVDEKGYVHVSGDMHGYGSGKGYDHLPVRYNPRITEGKCMYWRSARPEDISELIWLGASIRERPQGDYFSYMAFVNDRDGHLYYYSRQRRSPPRQMLWVANQYDALAGTWSFIGGTHGTPYSMPLTIWEEGGENGNHYVRSQGWMYHDPAGRMHLLTTVITGQPTEKLPGGHWVTDCVYVVSDDHGATAKRLDGTVIPWPARAKAGPNQGEVVHSKHYMHTPVSLAIDVDGSPVVMLRADGKSFLCYRDAAGKKWLTTPPINGEKIFNDSQGVLTALGRDGMTRMWHPTGAQVTHPLKHRIHMIDRGHLRRRGDFRGLGREGNHLALVEVTIKRPPTKNGDVNENAP